MKLNLSFLSGEPIARLQMLPSETVADLKEKLFKSSDSTWSSYQVEVLLSGNHLENSKSLGDLSLDDDAQLHVIRWLKSAREILFERPEVVRQLAKHYDTLCAESGESVRTLFLDQHGNDRPLRGKIEVLIAMHGKLSQIEGLENLKASLAEVALAALSPAEDDLEPELPPHARHWSQLVCMFPWLGFPAVLALLHKSSSLSCLLSSDRVRAILVSEYKCVPGATRKELLQQLPCLPKSDKSPHGVLRSILEDQVPEEIKKDEAKQKPAKQRTSNDIDSKKALPPRLLETVDDVVAAVQRWRPCRFAETKCEDELELRSFGDSVFEHTRNSCSRSIVVAAVEQAPDILMPCVDFSVALTAVERYQGVYQYLPQALKRERSILYFALECDPLLQEEYLRTACKSEIHEWKWHMEQRLRSRRTKTSGSKPR